MRKRPAFEHRHPGRPQGADCRVVDDLRDVVHDERAAKPVRVGEDHADGGERDQVPWRRAGGVFHGAGEMGREAGATEQCIRGRLGILPDRPANEKESPILAAIESSAMVMAKAE